VISTTSKVHASIDAMNALFHEMASEFIQLSRVIFLRFHFTVGAVGVDISIT
jgi:hypothetical protein